MRKTRSLYNGIYPICLLLFFSVFSQPMATHTKRGHHALVFMMGLLKNPTIVGALTPSSPYVAHELAQPLSHHYGPKRILEIGAGTGQITDTLVKKIDSSDMLDVVELNNDFCKVLSKRYKDYPNVTIFSGSILDWYPEKKYDFIICTLPFNRFSCNLTEQIMLHIQKLLTPSGVFSYIELKYLTYFRQLLFSSQQLREFACVRAYMDEFKRTYCYQNVIVLRNFPPAEVFHCRPKK